MDYRKKFLLTVGLRAVTGLLAFGGFCILIAPYTAKPLTTPNIITILLVGMMYAVSFGRPGMVHRILLIVVLAFTMAGTLDFPLILSVIIPMGFAALGSAFFLPYPVRNHGGQDGKPDDVRTLPSREAQRRPSDDP